MQFTVYVELAEISVTNLLIVSVKSDEVRRLIWSFADFRYKY